MSLPNMMPIHQHYLSSFHNEALYNSFNFVAADQQRISCIQNYDKLLHQTLTAIFREHDCASPEMIKNLLRVLENTDEESIVKMALKEKPELGEQFPISELEDLPPLWTTILFSCHKSAELLVRSGANVNERFGHPTQCAIDEKSSLLHSLLMMFPTSWNERLIYLIAEHGADLHARDSYGRTPLHYAVKNGRVEVARMFLEKGADANAMESSGMTPLLMAADTNDAGEMMYLLLEYGADATTRDTFGYNALHWLTCNPKGEHVDLARLLIEKGASIHDRDYFLLYQPVHTAAQMGYNEMLKLYLDHGAEINAESSYREFPLTLTVTNLRKHLAVMETLLQRGADPNIRTARERTPLHRACENSKYFQGMHLKIKLLLLAGADVLAVDGEGNTPFALMQGDDENGGCRRSSQLILKALALKRSRVTTELEDESIINRDDDSWNYFQVCRTYIDVMRDTKFMETCSFYELLTKCSCKIAKLMKHHEFDTSFMMHDLDDLFPIYADDIRGAFERAQDLYRSILETENTFSGALYHEVPDLILWKIACYICHPKCGNVT